VLMLIFAYQLSRNMIEHISSKLQSDSGIVIVMDLLYSKHIYINYEKIFLHRGNGFGNKLWHP